MSYIRAARLIPASNYRGLRGDVKEVSGHLYVKPNMNAKTIVFRPKGQYPIVLREGDTHECYDSQYHEKIYHTRIVREGFLIRMSEHDKIPDQIE